MASETRAGTADPKEIIDALEAQLAETPQASRPYEHAVLAYRLGLAYAESSVGSREAALRKALAYFDVAAAIFDRRYDPVEHARVLNAAGAAHRALANRRKAAELFEQAAALFDGRGRDDEHAAALNNLGLALTEQGDVAGAVAAFDRAVDLFDASSPEGRRGRIATLHNRGQARAAAGGEENLEAALADFEEARSELDPDDAPYHHGLVHHSVGVTCTALATLRPDEREEFLKEAVHAFQESLHVFTRVGFPYQYALAKHNLGLAWLGLGGTMNVRRALACFEDTVAVLDTRVHADAWRQAYANLERAEKELAASAPGVTRADHFAALVAGVKEDERKSLLRERLVRLLALPEPRRTTAIAELDLAIAKLPQDKATLVIAAELDIVMELPRENQETALEARWEAQRQLEGDARESADRALDQAIGDALGGPQRIFVRDYIISLGWERP